MKANELMINDWVAQKHSGLLLKVSEVRPPYIIADGEDGQFHEDTLEPIPLTPEILEKNGWNKDFYSKESYDNGNIEGLSLWIAEDGKNKWWWHVGWELVTPINDVHQLQHALRLRGIDKEIVL